jgi:uncharacterized protein YcnI
MKVTAIEGTSARRGMPNAGWKFSIEKTAMETYA